MPIVRRAMRGVVIAASFVVIVGGLKVVPVVQVHPFYYSDKQLECDRIGLGVSSEACCAGVVRKTFGLSGGVWDILTGVCSVVVCESDGAVPDLEMVPGNPTLEVGFARDPVNSGESGAETILWQSVRDEDLSWETVDTEWGRTRVHEKTVGAVVPILVHECATDAFDFNRVDFIRREVSRSGGVKKRVPPTMKSGDVVVTTVGAAEESLITTERTSDDYYSQHGLLPKNEFGVANYFVVVLLVAIVLLVMLPALVWKTMKPNFKL